MSDPAVPKRVIVSMPEPLGSLKSSYACAIVKTIVTKNNNSNPQNSSDIKFILCIYFSSFVFIASLADTKARTLKYDKQKIEANMVPTIV